MDASNVLNLLNTAGGASKLTNTATPTNIEIVSEDDPNCKNRGVTDSGIQKASMLKSVLSGAVLLINLLASYNIAKKQRELGRKYYELAEEHRNYYNSKFKPLEVSLTQEALVLPSYVRDKEQLNTGQMLVSVRGRNAGRIDRAISCTGRYCTGQRAAIMNDQLLEQAVIESTVSGLGHRYTDREEITHNNLRWEKREQVMKIGRDIPTDAVSYASLASGIFGSLGKQAGMAAEGAMGFLAYGREDTNYPSRRSNMTIAEYKWTPTKLETFKPKPPDTYVPPKDSGLTIKLSG